LFFADDLILFGEASLPQMNVISSCLTTFCCASGAKVSIEKTKMLVSQNVNVNRAREVNNMFGFGLTSDFGKYLGVPIIHFRKKTPCMNLLSKRFEKGSQLRKLRTLHLLEGSL
jgi:hypothetical protein